MELLEDQDPEKKKLIETSERHKRALEKEVGDMTKRTEQMLTNALIIGGSLAATYFIISSISGRKKKKKQKNAKAKSATTEGVEENVEEDHGPSVMGQIGSKILNQATILLLDLAKEKLFEYLESRKKADENS